MAPVHLMRDAATAFPEGSPFALQARVWKRGRAGLQVGLGIGLALILALTWWAPEFVWLLPLAIAALWAWYQAFRFPVGHLALVLAGFAVVARAEEGFQPAEVVYGLFYVVFLAHWYGSRLLAGRRFIHGFSDRVVALLLVGGLGIGSLSGLLFGASLGDIVGDALGFGMLAFFFPVKELCREHEQGATIVAVVTAWVGLYIAVVHFLHYREIVVSATEAWQVADARPGYNALQLMVPVIGAQAFLISSRSWWLRPVLLGVMLICALALALIKYRAFWVGGAFGIAILFLLFHGSRRWKLAYFLLVSGLAAYAFSFLLLGQDAVLFLTGLLNRFVTLGTAFSKDVSLINRLVESGAVWNRIEKNPILGYGLGTNYSYFSLVYLGTRVTKHIHNGYVGLWFKLGLWGVVLGFSYLIGAITSGFRVYRSQLASELEQVCALAALASLCALSLTIASENPFFLRDQMYTIALLTGLCIGLDQRYRHKHREGSPQPRELH